MNRKEKRDKGIKEKEKTYTLKQSDINEIKLNATKNAIDSAFYLTMAIPLLILHDKHDYGNKRATKVLMECKDYFESVSSGYITIMDVVKQVKEDLQIDLLEVLHEV